MTTGCSQVTATEMLSGKSKQIRFALTAMFATIGICGWLLSRNLSEKRTEFKPLTNEQPKVSEQSLIAEPTDFYSAVAGPEEVRTEPTTSFSESQIKRDAILVFLQHKGADQIADSWFAAVQEHATADQFVEARMLAKKYDSRLKNLRRERAEILEQAGVSIEDPEESLKRVRIQVRQLIAEARSELTREILTKTQRLQVRESAERRSRAKLQREQLKKDDSTRVR